MPEDEFETLEFKEKLEEATEHALEAAEHRRAGWCTCHLPLPSSPYLQPSPRWSREHIRMKSHSKKPSFAGSGESLRPVGVLSG